MYQKIKKIRTYSAITYVDQYGEIIDKKDLEKLDYKKKELIENVTLKKMSDGRYNEHTENIRKIDNRGVKPTQLELW